MWQLLIMHESLLQNFVNFCDLNNSVWFIVDNVLSDKGGGWIPEKMKFELSLLICVWAFMFVII